VPDVITAAATPNTPRIRVRERIGGGFMRLAKVFGTAVPADIAAAETAAGMDSSTPFSPGAPLSPYDGYSRTPRSQNFVPQVNVTTRPRTHERVSFETLKGLIDAYDIATMAIWHRIDSLRSLDWSLVAADGFEGDVADAVAIGMSVLAKPDGQTPFGAWLAEWVYDILAFDAGTLWRMRNRAGQVVGLRVVDGSLIAPLLDDWGNTPQAPAPAFVQYINGLPWNWLTTNDLIYRPFRKRPDSPYGRPPLESILLNANTDLRFQAYFLQRFTEGNLPAAFASAPDSWTPQQIEQFQEYWDGFILGDQSFKSQIRWIPPGSKIEWSNEKDFTDAFSLFMMRKTLAAYHVVPSDMGITDTVNKSTGETQRDVQHRIGDVPLARHVSDILTAFLQDDLHLPVKHQFDFGEEQDDRLQLAQADDIYIKNGTVSNSDIRELRFGLSEPEGKRVPRFVYSNRGGPIPLSALEAVAGPIDFESGAPQPGAPLPHTVFQPVEGVEGNPPTPRPPLAVEQYGPGALPVAAPQSVPALPVAPVQAELKAAPVAKDGPTAGITAATGITSYDLVGRHDDEDDDEDEAVAKELAAYRRFAKARRRDGRWRDFQFQAVDAATARSLNEAGHQSVLAKQSGIPGLTKRSGMISLDLPAGLVPTVPGGVNDHHVTVVYLGPDVANEEFDTACDRAEAAAAACPGPLTGTIAGIDTFPPSSGSDGKIPAFVPVTLPGVEQVRASLEDLSASEHTDYHPHVTLAYLDEGDPLPDPVPPTLVTFTHLTVHRGDETRSFPLGPRMLGLAKAAAGSEPGPKADASAKEASSHWPGWDYDETAADHWARKLADGYVAALSVARAQRIAASFLAAHPGDGEKHTKAETAAIAAALLAAALAHLEDQNLDLTSAATATLQGLYTDAYLIGAASGNAVIDGGKPVLTGWSPGKTDEAHGLIEALALGTGLSALLRRAPETAAAMSSTRMAVLASALAAGAAAGQSAAIIAGSLIAVLKAGWRSLTAAITEVTSASSAGASDAYQKRGITLYEWALDPSVNNCPICITNANSAPRKFGQKWPSGQAAPPIHGRCRCALVPA
jgi:2'-5' RNA ligase